MKTFLALASLVALCGSFVGACSSDPARRPSAQLPSTGGGSGGAGGGSTAGVGNSIPESKLER